MSNSSTDKKKVIIISVPYCDPYPMVAPVLLSGCLCEAGIPAKAIDFNLKFIKKFSEHEEFFKLKSFLTMGRHVTPSFTKTLYKDIIKFIIKFLKKVKRDYDPEYIGLSVFTSESLDFSLILSYLIRKYLPKTKIVAGGKGLEVYTANSSNFHYETWIKHNIADLIIVGDAETSLISALKNNRTGIYFSEQQTKEDLDNIPLPNWKDYNISEYESISNRLNELSDGEILNMGNDGEHNLNVPYLTITSSKGCVRKCSFCDVASFWPTYLYRDPVKVAEEIIHNYKNTGIQKYMFTDNLINGSVSNFRKMNEVLVQEIPRKISYEGYAIFRSAHAMPEKDFELASLAGNTYWSVGVESGSEKIRETMKKKFSDDDLEWSVKMLCKYNIRQNWLLMVGYPLETEEDFDQTKEMIRKFSYLVKGKNITVQVTPPFMVLRNSPLITNPFMARTHGLEHLLDEENNINVNNFWVSTANPHNTYPERSRRWRELVKTIKDNGYHYGPGMPLKKWAAEINSLEKLYKEKYDKTTINIHRSS